MDFNSIFKCLLCHGSLFFGQLEKHLKTEHRAVFYVENLIHLTKEAKNKEKSNVVDVDLLSDLIVNEYEQKNISSNQFNSHEGYGKDIIIKHDNNHNSESIVVEDDDISPHKSVKVENKDDFESTILEALKPTLIKNENIFDDQDKLLIETNNFVKHTSQNNNFKRPHDFDTKIQPTKKLKSNFETDLILKVETELNQNLPLPLQIPQTNFKSEPTSNLTWATIIPLIGGSAIGCSQSAGSLPSFHMSYAPFKANENHLDKYWPSVPKYLLDLEPNVKLPRVDYVNAVCPCAGLSMLNAGRNNEGGVARGSDNETNKWMINSSHHVLGKIKPKVFWGENAPGLFSDMGKGLVEDLVKIGKMYGYSFSLMRTTSELHGLPQKRIRTFYFFWNTPTVPKLNWKNTPAKNLLEFLNEIPKYASLQDVFLNDGKASERFRPYQFVLEREGLTHAEFAKKQKTGTISQYLEKNNLEQECIDWLRKNYPNDKFAQGNRKGGVTHIQYIEHCMYKKSIGKGYWDASPKFFDNTINAVISKTMDTALHPVEDRYLSVREMMHLMGLPHDFELQVKLDQPKQSKKIINHIAQNVPVNTAKDWADEVKLFCEGKLPLTDYTFLKQDNIAQALVAKTSIGEEKPVVTKIGDEKLVAARDKKSFSNKERRSTGLDNSPVSLKSGYKNPTLADLLNQVNFSW